MNYEKVQTPQPPAGAPSPVADKLQLFSAVNTHTPPRPPAASAELLLNESTCSPCGNVPAPGRGDWILAESRWSSVRAEREERDEGMVVDKEVSDRSLKEKKGWKSKYQSRQLSREAMK